MLKVAIFCEYGVVFGMGHYSRCLLLKQKLHTLGFEVFLFAYNQDSQFDQAWFYRDNILSYLEGIDFVIIDSYQAESRVYEIALQKVKKVIVIDDIARIPFPRDCVIFNGGIDTKDLYIAYPNEVYAGIEFMICDELFFQEKKVQSDRLIICFGGSDEGNFTQAVYDKVRDFFSEIIVILGPCYKAHFYGDCKIYRNIDVKSLCELFATAGYAITAGGRMLNELLMSEILSIVIPVAKNQMHQVEAYARYNVIIQTTLEHLQADIQKTNLLSKEQIYQFKKKFGSQLNDKLLQVLK